MEIFELLDRNKGTVSSALGKELAEKVLAGDREILEEAIRYSVYDPENDSAKHIRSGAAKVVEIVAEARPEWVSGALEELLPALRVPEPQTRWMIIRVMGFCAHLNAEIALEAFPYAVRYVERKEGLCIASSADLFLGDLGAVSRDNTLKVLPVLLKSVDTLVLNEQDWLLESFIRIAPNLDKNSAAAIKVFAERWKESSRNTTKKRAGKLLKIL